jgi:prepilin-type N-terminal cleavage/methylation domain-containing protein
MRPSASCRRLAFTLIELMVVLAIMSILLALMLSAVQHVRETASRLRCANNLRQIGLATLGHHDAYGMFPNNGGWDGHQTIRSVDGTPFTPFTVDYSLGVVWYWGVGQSGLTPRQQTGSWCYAILPFIEQQNMYQQQAWYDGVTLYDCPSRRSSAPQAAVADRYGFYNGGGWTWGKSDYAANAYLVPNRTVCHSIADISDGTSHTILTGEKAMDRTLYNSGTWFWDEPFFLGGSDSTHRLGTSLIPDAAGIALITRQNWGSPHSSGPQFVLADGSVRSLSYATAPSAVLALLTPASGDLAPE